MSEALKIAALKAQQKNLAAGVVLTVLFGGLGLLYVSIMAGIIAIVIGLVLFLITTFTLGLGGILFLPYWVICIIYAIVAINGHNRRLYGNAMSAEKKAEAKAANVNKQLEQ